MQVNVLRGEVAAKFGSCENFAKALNWSGRKARDIVSGRQRMTADDIVEMSEALGINDNDELIRIFFNKPATK